ncbi:nucleotidyltransferase family protein [Shewanella sp. Isolate11]|uniref:nucleotidyltransferase family protein n=1 Tax=Shewanella sp. Isolate11 TaxID=2908530 RepID=UPI001EFCEEA6|nr:nucleotidyltransferase family protein [Shewanella sp. Isolate11]
MKNANNDVIALLAAGASQRFGGVKLTQPLSSSMSGETETTETVIGTVYYRLSQVADITGARLVVVVGGHSEQVIDCLPKDAEVLENEHWQKGIGHSIGKAAQFAQQQQASSLMIALGDQVALTLDDYLRLFIARHRPETRVSAFYDQTPSVPAIFHQQDFDDLTQLSGDTGAKSLLQQRYQEGKLIATHLPRGEIDIDTPEQLTHFCQSQLN